MPEISNGPTPTDVVSGDVRKYREDTSNIIGPEKDTALWINEQDISVTTNFPAPSWFR